MEKKNRIILAQLFIMPMMFVLALLMAIDSIKICKESN